MNSADISILLVKNMSSSGIAGGIKNKASDLIAEYQSILPCNCKLLCSRHSPSCQIGHMLGAAHDLQKLKEQGKDISEMSAAKYGAGNPINGTNKGSILAYQTKENYVRINYYAGSQVKDSEGVKTGDGTHDVARCHAQGN